MKPILTAVSIFLAVLMIGGCNVDGNSNTSNGRLIVYNETDRAIEVQYTQQTDSGFVDKTAQIETNSQAVMYVYALWYDAEVVVVYNGISREYDLDFRITETAELYVHTEDFQQ